MASLLLKSASLTISARSPACGASMTKNDGSRWGCAELDYAALEANGLVSVPRFLGFITARDLLMVLATMVELPAVSRRLSSEQPPS